LINLTKDDVELYLKEVKDAIKQGKYEVKPRVENELLFEEYVFYEEDQKQILLSLEAEDFSEADYNNNPKTPAQAKEILYVFGKDVSLLPRFGGGQKTVSLYIKFNKKKNVFVIVVSFHEQNYPLQYKFK